MAIPTPEEVHAPVVQGAPEPMQLGLARFTPAEHQHRFKGRLCFYCGQPGHIRNNLPSLPKAQAHLRKGVPRWVEAKSVVFSFPLCNHMEVPIKPFADSGADENFIAADFVELHDIPVFSLTVPRHVNALDGRLSVITHQTVPLCLLISGNHHELISFFIMPASYSCCFRSPLAKTA